MTPPNLMNAIGSLLAIGLPDKVTLHRRVLSPIEQDRLPAIVPYLMDMKPKAGQDTGNDLREYDASIRIECRATGTPIEDALWPLVFHVQKAILTAPPFLDGWAMEIEEEDIQFNAILKDKAYCAVAMDYRARIVYSLGLGKPAPVLKEISYEPETRENFNVP
jgi:hypothetical protein